MRYQAKAECNKQTGIQKNGRLKEENQRIRTCTDDGLSPEFALVLEVEEREHRGRPRTADLARPGPWRGLGCLRGRRLPHREDKRKGNFNTVWNLRHDQIQSVDRGFGRRSGYLQEQQE